MFCELKYSFAQARLPEQDHVVQTRLLNRANKPLGERIQIGRPGWQSERFNSTTLEDLSELPCEECGSILDEE